MFVALFNKQDDLMDNNGILGYLECVFWENQIFLWAFSVASTYNTVMMTVERSVVIIYNSNNNSLSCTIMVPERY